MCQTRSTAACPSQRGIALWRYLNHGRFGRKQLSIEHGTCQTAKAKFSPWLSGKSPSNRLRCCLFARERLCRLHFSRSVAFIFWSVTISCGFHFLVSYIFLVHRTGGTRWWRTTRASKFHPSSLKPVSMPSQYTLNSKPSSLIPNPRTLNPKL